MPDHLEAIIRLADDAEVRLERPLRPVGQHVPAHRRRLMERAAGRLDRQRPVGRDLHGAPVRVDHRRRHVRAGRHEQLVLQFPAGIAHLHVDAIVQPRVAHAAEGAPCCRGRTRRRPSPARRDSADAPSNSRRTESCADPRPATGSRAPRTTPSASGSRPRTGPRGPPGSRISRKRIGDDAWLLAVVGDLAHRRWRGQRDYRRRGARATSEPSSPATEEACGEVPATTWAPVAPMPTGSVAVCAVDGTGAGWVAGGRPGSGPTPSSEGSPPAEMIRPVQGSRRLLGRGRIACR